MKAGLKKKGKEKEHVQLEDNASFTSPDYSSGLVSLSTGTKFV